MRIVKKNKKDIKKEINIVNIPMRMQQLDYLRADIEKSMIKIAICDDEKTMCEYLEQKV